ncbi:MAG: PKD domain-containing protein [Bacteroidetes bacterium]|nr:MAG: PKD domain-containing protein [Bacteroidota bacterium]REK32310.1 MAG: PKD domain-containing protein [Bacteroidota bacterium]REK49544.1 MAG: PKD domain-containing protein [Bacteroidota bacterium]
MLMCAFMLSKQEIVLNQKIKLIIMKKQIYSFLRKTIVLFVLVFAGTQANAQCNAFFYTIPDSTGYGFQFVDSSGSPVFTPVSWFWDFGDGTSSTQQNPFHTYNRTGAVQVCHTVAYSSGCTATICDSLLLGNANPCLAQFNWYQSGTNLVQFTDMSQLPSAGNSWNWDFGNGITSSLRNPQISLAPGAYYVCLTVSNAMTSCQDTYCDSILVTSSGSCQASFNVQQSPTGSITFVNTSNAQNIVSVWDFGDGNVMTVNGTSSVSHAYVNPGVYVVCLTVSNRLCTDTYCDSVLINTQSGCQAMFSSVTDSSGLIATFTDLSQGNITSWHWDFGDSTYSTVQNPVHTYASNGTYNVCLTITDANGCRSTYCSNLNAFSACTPVFIALPDSSNPSGSGSTMLFQVNQNVFCGTPSIIIWDFGDGSYDSSGTFTPTHYFDTTGLYTICVYVVIGSDTLFFCNQVNVQRISTGIHELSQLASAIVYPNPAFDAVNVRLDLITKKEFTVSLYNVRGGQLIKSIISQSFSGANILTIPLTELPSGIYYMKIATDNETTGRKFIISR